MNDDFESRLHEAGAVSETSELALSQYDWAPRVAPLDVPRQTLERRAATPAWQSLVGRTGLRNA